MARLTKQMQSGEWIIDGNREEAAAKLAAYEDAEEKGRLLVLPCSFGDSLYRIRRFKRGGNWKKEAAHILSTTLTMNNVANVLFGDVMGKTVFLTREEAETALATDTNVGHIHASDLYDEDGGEILGGGYDE